MPIYPGGYQIIDMKGLEPSVSPIDDPDIIQKLEYALLCKKPLYIANYTDTLEYLVGPLLMDFTENNTTFTHIIMSTTMTPIASVYLYKDTGKWYFAENEA